MSEVSLAISVLAVAQLFAALRSQSFRVTSLETLPSSLIPKEEGLTVLRTTLNKVTFINFIWSNSVQYLLASGGKCESSQYCELRCCRPTIRNIGARPPFSIDSAL
jgi:hypothetical protein